MPRHTSLPNDSRTQRGDGAMADINSIVARATRTGILGTGNGTAQPRFMDVSSLDFMAMNNLVVDAKQAFLGFSSKIRARFSNDPYQLLRFLEDPNNKAEAIRLGIVTEAYQPPKTLFDMTAEEFAAAMREPSEKPKPKPDA